MTFSIFRYKLNLLKKQKKKERKKNKYLLYQYKKWSLQKIENHINDQIFIKTKEIKECIISKKKKTINYDSNINSHIFKKLISNGELSNLKKSIW